MRPRSPRGPASTTAGPAAGRAWGPPPRYRPQRPPPGAGPGGWPAGAWLTGCCLPPRSPHASRRAVGSTNTLSQLINSYLRRRGPAGEQSRRLIGNPPGEYPATTPSSPSSVDPPNQAYAAACGKRMRSNQLSLQAPPHRPTSLPHSNRLALGPALSDHNQHQKNACTQLLAARHRLPASQERAGTQRLRAQPPPPPSPNPPPPALAWHAGGCTHCPSKLLKCKSQRRPEVQALLPSPTPTKNIH